MAPDEEIASLNQQTRLLSAQAGLLQVQALKHIAEHQLHDAQQPRPKDRLWPIILAAALASCATTLALRVLGLH